MEGFIPSAGLGTRLLPLTKERPKAMVLLNGKPLIYHAIMRLTEVGVEHVVVNIHHHAEILRTYLTENKWPCRISISDEREKLMDTGGGLQMASKHFSEKEEVIVHNVDVVSDYNLLSLIDAHRKEEAAATLCVSHRKTSRYLLVDEEKRLVGWHNEKTDEYIWVEKERYDCEKVAFNGIAVLSPMFYRSLPNRGMPYPIVPEYIRAAGEMRVRGYEYTEGRWMDVGTIDKLKEAEKWNIF